MSIKVNTATLTNSASYARKIGTSVGSCAASLRTIRGSLPSEVRYKNGIDSSLYSAAAEISNTQERIERISSFLDYAANAYRTTEHELTSVSSRFWEDLKMNYGWNELLAGSNYINTIYGLVKSFRSATTGEDYVRTGLKTYEFLTGAAHTYKNYKLIGNAVGSGTARTWWFKNVVGWKSLGRASSAANVFTRFKNNLLNKTSPFNAQAKKVIGNFTGANGVGKAVASWGTLLVNGVVNYSSNRKEQAASGGTMSNGRVIAETITETAVDTTLTYGAGIVVGAAVTTVLGPVAAPGIVVVALSGLLVAGVNATVKAITGQSTTEWISDAILDAGSYIAKKVGNAVSNASKAVANWFGRLSFA